MASCRARSRSSAQIAGEREDGVGLGELRRGAEPLAVEAHGLLGAARVHVAGEGEAHPERRGHPGAVVARAEHPDRRQGDVHRLRPHPVEGVLLGQAVAAQGDQLHQLGREVLRARRLRRPAQGHRREAVGAGRPSDAEVDPAGVEGLQHLEGLGDVERRVVGQHDPARPHPDPRRGARDPVDEDLRRRARHPGQVVVLGEPVAPVAPAVGRPGQVHRVLESLARRSRPRGRA